MVPKKPNSVLARWWMMTYANPLLSLEEVYVLSKASYCVGQLETAGSGLVHLQAVFWWSSKRLLSSLKKVLKEAHWEPCIDSEASRRYCSKVETRTSGPWSFGTYPVRTNSKTDWEYVWTLAKRGELESIPGSIRVQHYSNLKKIEKDYMVGLDHSQVRGLWIYGKPGIGKSYFVRKCLTVDPVYPKLPNKWWDGYRQETHVVLEDLDHETVKYLGNHLKYWADSYGFIGESKGGCVTPSYKWFVVTSNYSMSDLFRDCDLELQRALERRFKEYRMVSIGCFVRDGVEYTEETLREIYK